MIFFRLTLIFLVLSGTPAVAASWVDVTAMGAQPGDDMDDWAAFTQAVDAVDPGGVVFVPAGLYHFRRPLVISKPLMLAGQGPASVLQHVGNMGTEGAANFIRVVDVEHVTLQDLTLRGARGPGIRTPLIRVAGWVSDVTLQRLHLEDSSSSAILLMGDVLRKIAILDNVADEFYEQFVEFGSADIQEVTVARNTAKSTAGHPELGSTEPFGIAFEPANRGVNRVIATVSIHHNTIDFTGMPNADRINTGGISLSVGVAPYRYERIYIIGNTVRHAGNGIRVQALRHGDTMPGSVVVASNRVEEATREGISLRPAISESAQDVMIVMNNTIVGYSRQAYGSYDGISLFGVGFGPQITKNSVLAGAAGHIGRYALRIDKGIEGALVSENVFDGYRSGPMLDLGVGTEAVGNVSR